MDLVSQVQKWGGLQLLHWTADELRQTSLAVVCSEANSAKQGGGARGRSDEESEGE
jgi:hypothetical protein